jgi:hypothetical protein
MATRKHLIALLAIGIAVASQAAALRASPTSPIAGPRAGGGIVSGGVFTAKVSIGVAEAEGVSAGGAYELTGGILRRQPRDESLFADGFE